MRRRSRMWDTLAAAALLASCTPTINAYPGPPAGSASQVVDSTGGTVTTNEGTTLVIPPNALSQPVTITITLDPSAPPPPQATAVTAAHVFGPDVTFTQPVCITLAFEPPLLPQGVTEDDVVLYSATPGTSVYVPMPTTPVDATHVMGTTLHFGATVFAAYGGGAKEIPPDAAGAPTCDAGDGGDGGDGAPDAGVDATTD